MDRNITAWFYRFEPLKKGATPPLLSDVLASAWGFTSADARTRNIGHEDGDEIKVRLERFSSDGDFCFGQITRIQTTGIPPEAQEDGLKAISLKGQGLGHTVAFRYHKPSQVMAIQVNTKGVGAPRINGYLSRIDKAALYKAFRVPDDTEWSNYNRGEPRKVKLRLASVENPEGIKNDSAVASAAKTLQEIADAPYLTVEAYMGSRKGSLKFSGVKKLIAGLKKGGDMNLVDAQITAHNPDMRDNKEVLDILNPLISFRGTIAYKGSDPEKLYTNAESFLEKAFSTHIETIEKRYCKKNG